MIPYLVMIAVAYFLAQKIDANRELNPKIANRYKWYLIGLLTLFVGLRLNVGADYWAYIHDFRKFNMLSYHWIFTHKEPIIKLITKLVRKVTTDNVVIFTILAFIFVCPIVHVLYKEAKHFTISIILFIITGSYLECCNASRQCMAAGILFLNYWNVKEHKLGKYLITTAIAVLMHNTAIVTLPLYFILTQKTSKKQFFFLIAMAISMLIAFNLLFDVAETVTGRDIDTNVSYNVSSVGFLRVLVYIAPCALIFLISHQQRTEVPLLINLTLLNAIFMVATFRSTYLARIVIYTNVFLALSIPEFLDRLNPNTVNIVALKKIMYGCYGFFWIYGILVSANLYPYHCLFF